MTTNHTPEKLAQVAALVKAQKAKAAAQKATKKAKEVDPVKEAEKVARAERRVAKAAERASKKEALEAKRSAKRAENEAKKAARASEKAVKAPTDKVARLFATLPTVTPSLEGLVSVLTSLTDLELGSAHTFVDFVRKGRALAGGATATAGSSDDSELEPGDVVVINSAEKSKYVGLMGVLTEVRRVRVFVKVPGEEKPVYLLKTDVSLADEQVPAASLEQNILDVQEG
jgi:hypothetical protein